MFNFSRFDFSEFKAAEAKVKAWNREQTHICVVMLICGIVMIFSLMNPGLAAVASIALIASVVYYIYAVFAHRRSDAPDAWEVFASANGLDYTAGPESVADTRPAIFASADAASGKLSHVCVLSTIATYEDFTYIVSNGQSSTTYNYAILKIKLPHATPQVIIDSHGVSTDLIDRYHGEHLQLEGDFNEVFAVVVPEGYETEVLEILTPDVMSVLMDKGREFDYEFLDGELYVYAVRGADFAFPDFLDKITPVLNELYAAVADDAEMMTPAADAAVQSAPAEDLTRKKSNKRIVAIWIMTLIYLFAMFMPLIIKIIAESSLRH
jgi:Ca2+/Na+ antiporter